MIAEHGQRTLVELMASKAGSLFNAVTFQQVQPELISEPRVIPSDTNLRESFLNDIRRFAPDWANAYIAGKSEITELRYGAITRTPVQYLKIPNPQSF